MLVSLSQAFLTTLAIFFLTLLGSLPLGLVVYFEMCIRDRFL